VVVSPTAALHATPWGLLPALAGAPVTVVPSASTWLRARQQQGAPGRVLVTGPGLASGGAEVPRVAAEHPDAVVLTDGSATVERCLRAMDGAGLVHVAAHGRFRADNPMFSSLEMADGPLTVHDLEQLVRAPHRIVLSACDSGVMVPVGASELLGLASALMSLGTAGILSTVAPVNDEATAELMVDLHRDLGDLDDLGAAMQRVRARASGDVLTEATAAAFVPLGV
jgi:CHAT domain-containing protein